LDLACLGKQLDQLGASESPLRWGGIKPFLAQGEGMFESFCLRAGKDCGRDCKAYFLAKLGVIAAVNDLVIPEYDISLAAI
jgi:hypothetical protein